MEYGTSLIESGVCHHRGLIMCCSFLGIIYTRVAKVFSSAISPPLFVPFLLCACVCCGCRNPLFFCLVRAVHDFLFSVFVYTPHPFLFSPVVSNLSAAHAAEEAADNGE